MKISVISALLRTPAIIREKPRASRENELNNEKKLRAKSVGAKHFSVNTQ